MNEEILKPILSVKNFHERDSNISFEEKDHKYTIINQGTSITPYKSTTTFIHEQFEQFDADLIIKNMMKGKNWKTSKYYGMSVDDIKKIWNDNGSSVSKQGTSLHNNIEKFMNQELLENEEYTHENLLKNYEKNNILDDSIDWSLFIKYIKKYPNFVPYRTEWLIYDEEVKIAGSIDMVYLNDDGTIDIYDWKRSKKITKETFGNKYAINECINYLPDSNYFHYSLQLNIYKTIIEKNYNMKVKNLYLIRLHPENKNNTFEEIKVINLSNEVESLFNYRKMKQLKYKNVEQQIDKECGEKECGEKECGEKECEEKECEEKECEEKECGEKECGEKKTQEEEQEQEEEVNNFEY